MTLQHLRTFVEAFRYESLSQAAENLGITQPAVSQHIASLETQLGKALFVRQARGVQPTAFARDLAAQIGDGLDRAETALATMRARSAELSGALQIAGPAELMSEKVAPVLQSLVEAGLRVRLLLGGKASIYDALLNGDVDLAFTASEPDDVRLAAHPIGSERLLAVASPAMAARINALDDLNTALRSVAHVAYDLDRPLVRQWCDRNGIDLTDVPPSVTAPDIRLLRSLVETDAGWSVIPDYLCQAAIDSGALAPIKGTREPPVNTFYLVWAKSALRSPRVAYTRNLLLDNLRL